jgi:hypothetical protein
MDYKCNFLWPYDDDSWESFIYGIANANTEEYAEAIWKEMKERITELEGERDKLRDALERIGNMDVKPYTEESAFDMQDIAHTELEGQDD